VLISIVSVETSFKLKPVRRMSFFLMNEYRKMMGYGFAEIINRIIKYLIEGLVIAAAAIFIPKKALPFDEVATLAVLAAVVFAILDAVSPSVGVTARQGAGFGLGANLVGFPMR
jgi:hypothetical protein